MSTTIDPVTGELISESSIDGEMPDDIADPEGAAERALNKAVKPQLIPSYIEKDFEFRRGYKDQDVKSLLAAGKRAYFLQPRTTAVNAAITDAEGAIRAAMDFAMDAKNEELRKAAIALAGEIKDVDYTFGGLDEWLGDLVKRAVARQASSDAVFIARGDSVLSSWNAKDDNAIERRDSFESVLFSAQKRLATMLYTLHTMESIKLLNIKSAAWQRMQSEARKNQARFLHADEYHIQRELNGEHAEEGARVSRSGLIKRAA